MAAQWHHGGMPKRNSTKTKRPTADPNVMAHRSLDAIDKLTEELPKDVPPPLTIHDVMSEMGRRGGKIGGKQRLVTMTPQERTAAALKAARARWKKAKKG